MRSNERSPCFNVRVGENKDRRLWTIVFRSCNRLKISVLLILLSGQFAFSQKTNENIYFQMIQDLWGENKTEIRSVDGFVPNELKSEFVLDTSVSAALEVGVPQVEFQKLENGGFQRQVSAELVLTDSVPQTLGLTRVDTVSRKDLSKIRKSSYSELKGSDPRTLQKYVWPGLGVGGGIAVIISLFYTRSSAQ